MTRRARGYTKRQMDALVEHVRRQVAYQTAPSTTTAAALLAARAELSKAQAAIPVASGTGTARTQAVQDLAWALYNKVDFNYNY